MTNKNCKHIEMGLSYRQALELAANWLAAGFLTESVQHGRLWTVRAY